MNWQAALEIVVARTKHERFRELCADENPDVEQRDAYRDLVIRMACGELPEPPPFIDREEPPDPEAARLDAIMLACPSRTKPPCGCATGICSKLGREVVRFECHSCISGGRNV